MSDQTKETLRFRLIRSTIEWMWEKGYSPHIQLVANDGENKQFKDVIVPSDYVRDGMIILNLALRTVADFGFYPESSAISFRTRFNQKDTFVTFNVGKVIHVYAREDPEQQLFFQSVELPFELPETKPESLPKKPGGHLSVVK